MEELSVKERRQKQERVDIEVSRCRGVDIAEGREAIGEDKNEGGKARKEV